MTIGKVELEGIRAKYYSVYNTANIFFAQIVSITLVCMVIPQLL